MDVGIDIGNSNLTLGFKDGDNWKGLWRMPTTLDDPFTFYRTRWIDELLESGFTIDHISQISISSVVPDLTPFIEEVAKDVFGKVPYIINTSSYDLIDVSIDNKDQLGVDLYANAAAAYHRYRQSIIIVDFGTALTFTSVKEKGVLEGVAIVPGLKTAIKALSGNTAQLPEVHLLTPKSLIGKNTSEAIRAGILHGYVGLVKHMISETKKELGTNPKVIATGGLSKTLPLLEDEFDDIDVSLTLDGIIIIGKHIHQNQGQQGI